MFTGSVYSIICKTGTMSNFLKVCFAATLGEMEANGVPVSRDCSICKGSTKYGPHTRCDEELAKRNKYTGKDASQCAGCAKSLVGRRCCERTIGTAVQTWHKECYTLFKTTRDGFRETRIRACGGRGEVEKKNCSTGESVGFCIQCDGVITHGQCIVQFDGRKMHAICPMNHG